MELPAGWETETVEVDGVTLQTYHVGSTKSPPIIILHGFYENSRVRYRLANDLASDYHVVLYDARAHGKSDAPENGYGIEDRVGDLLNVVTAFDLEDPILFGHSMGGSTAAWTAATHPAVPRGLILEDPAGMRPEPDEPGPEARARIVNENLQDISDRRLADLALEYEAPSSEYAHWQAVADTELRPEISEITRAGYPHLADAFPQISCPSLVLRSDSTIDERITDLDMADSLEPGRLVHIPHSGHHIFRDQYDAAYRELRTSLRRLA